MAAFKEHPMVFPRAISNSQCTFTTRKKPITKTWKQIMTFVQS